MPRTWVVLGVGAAIVSATASCGGNNMVTGPGTMMATPPRAGASGAFLSVSPAGNSVGVSVDSQLAVHFNYAMSVGTEMLVYLHEGDVSGPVVPITRAWSADRTTLICTPTSRLRSGTRYTIHLGGGMVDANGHVIDWDDMPMMGGQWLWSGMMSGGLPSYMMGPGWQAANGSYGAVFSFTTG